MVKRRSKNILKSKNIRNKRSKIRRNRKNRKRSNLKRKTKNIKKNLVGGTGKNYEDLLKELDTVEVSEPVKDSNTLLKELDMMTIRGIYNNFLRYNKHMGGTDSDTSKKNVDGHEGDTLPDDVMQYLFEDILKNVSPNLHPGEELLMSYYNEADPSKSTKAPIYEIFGFDSVEEFEENRERLREEYEQEFGKYIPPVDVSKDVVHDYGRLNQTTKKPTFLEYGHGYNPHQTAHKKGDIPHTVYKVNPSLRGFRGQFESDYRNQRKTKNPKLEKLNEESRESDKQAMKKIEKGTEESIDKMMKYFAGGGK